MRDHKAEMLDLVEVAFASVRLEDGVSLRETLVLDDHGTMEQRTNARRIDETEDWRRIVSDPELARLAYIGGIAFYDPKGMRFHLPAYLTLAITSFEEPHADNVIEVLMYFLTDPASQRDERFSLLSQAQRSCVAEILTHLRTTYELESTSLDAAIPYWRSSM